MQRYEYLDISKGIGILLVVWAHILLVGTSHRVIYAFHMPLFFLISGMLFRRDKYPDLWIFLKKRAKRLLVPFAIYSVVTWIFWASFRFLRHDNVVSYWDPLLQTVLAKGSGAYMVHNSALWFIPCLFATEILYFAFSRLADILKFAACVSCAALSFILGHYFGDDWWFLLPWNFDAALIGVLFYCIGNIFASRVPNSKLVEYTKGHIGRIVSLFVASSGILCWSAMQFGECSMGSSSYQCNGAIFVIRSLIGCAACILLSLLLGRLSSHNIIKNYLEREGINSLDIMSIHIPVKGIVIMALAVCLHMNADIISSDLAYSTLAFIITMVIVDSMVCAINKGKTFSSNRKS